MIVFVLMNIKMEEIVFVFRLFWKERKMFVEIFEGFLIDMYVL